MFLFLSSASKTSMIFSTWRVLNALYFVFRSKNLQNCPLFLFVQKKEKKNTKNFIWLKIVRLPGKLSGDAHDFIFSFSI